ncbi:MAG: penicillin-binding protein 2 [Anaerolineae bacterium]
MSRWWQLGAPSTGRRLVQGLGKGDAESARPPWVLRAPRIAMVGWIVLLILGLYLIRLWQLQFLEGGSWRARAEQQQSRLETISPARGVIYDRNGDILVRNIPAYNVTVTPGELPDDFEDPERRREVLMRLAQLLAPEVTYTSEGLDQEPYRLEIQAVGREHFPPYGEAPDPGLVEMIERVRYVEPFKPIVVAQNVDRDLALLIAQEGGVTMPGVGIEIVSRRKYTYGEATSQILGFLGPIPQERVEEFEQKGYDPSVDRIGYAGIEAELEEALRGIPGRRMVEKDVLGQEISVLNETPPSPGDNVHLTLDIQLQLMAEEALRQGMAEAGSERAALVVLDPRDGQVLSMVSLPTYDNNMFSKKLDLDEYEALLNDPHHPFINHAIADQIPAGSIFKIVPATAGLQEGIINRFTTLNCPGRMLLPNKFAPDDMSLAQPFYCWIDLQLGHGHGPLNVVDALAQSCDIFFYQVGGGFEETDFEGLGAERLAAYAREFGLGSLTGIDLPGEMAGLVPTPQWKRQFWQETWTTGNTYNLAIGQGDLLVTPLQMANALAVVANGGALYQPHVVHHVEDVDQNLIRPFTPVVSHTMQIDQSVWQVVREGLDLAVSEDGTGHRAVLDDIGVNVAGKTGTAEYCDDIAYEAGWCDVAEGETLPTHAWFMAYGPVEAPEVVVAVWIYDGGEGSVTAAPVARDVLDFYFRRKLGLLGVEEVEDAESTEDAGQDALPDTAPGAPDLAPTEGANEGTTPLPTQPEGASGDDG